MDNQHNPRKRFGQNFLVDTNFIDKIVNNVNPKKGEHLIEIGPGLGAITSRVLERIDHFTAIEIDKDLAANLQALYPNNLTLYQQDALTFDFTILNENNLRLFGNLPYNISTPLLFHFLSFAPLIQNMCFMLQKEVVQRMCSPHSSKEYGRLSVMIQYACKVEKLFDIPPNAFKPAPKVTSSLVYLTPYQQNRPHSTAKNEKVFSHLVNVAFQQRRKTLKNCLKSMVEPHHYAMVGIDPMRRPETLSVEEFVQLSNCID